MKKIKTADLRMAISGKKRKEKSQHKKQVKFLTKKDFSKDISEVFLYKRGKKTGQLTKKSVIFEIGDLELRLSLFFDTKSPKKFNVTEWFNRKSYGEKFLISELLHKFIIEKVYKDYSETVHNVMSDVVEGEDKNIIGYFIEILNHTDLGNLDDYLIG
jgi:hypothetical protein